MIEKDVKELLATGKVIYLELEYDVELGDFLFGLADERGVRFDYVTVWSSGSSTRTRRAKDPRTAISWAQNLGLRGVTFTDINFPPLPK